MIAVESRVRICEIDGTEMPIGSDAGIIVESHWNDDALVVVAIDGKEYTVVGRELEAAIKNAQNSVR